MSKCGNVQKVFVPADKDQQKEQVNHHPARGISITDKAAEKIKHFLKSDGKSVKAYGLKVSVVQDGCSGKSYNMDLAPIKDGLKDGDRIFTKDGATVIIEKLSYMFLIGSELDYVETLLMSGFQLVNPNVKKSCSCGSSFAV